MANEVCGQSRAGAKLSDRDVELLRGMRAMGWGYRRLAAKFEISKTLAMKICKGLKRSRR